MSPKVQRQEKAQSARKDMLGGGAAGDGARDVSAREARTMRADFESYIYDLICDATKAFLAHERDARLRDPDGRYVSFSDAFTAHYLAAAMAQETQPLEYFFDELKKIMLAGDASFELIGKVQLWACGLWGHCTAMKVGSDAAIKVLKAAR